MGKFDSKVVVITGASSGIGAATAIAFAKEGAKLTIIGRNEERLKRTRTICAEAGCFEILEIVADIREFGNLEMLINKTVEKFGGIDILVNNAGQGILTSIEMVQLEEYEELFKANVRAPVFLSKYALPYLKQRKGCVVNVSSSASMISVPMNVPYCMSKAALDHFTRGFAAECAKDGVRVNSINPGVVATAFVDNNIKAPQEVKEKIKKSLTSLQKLGVIDANEIAEGILFICSSPHMTGSTLLNDGGMILQK